jgi:protein SCO1/2
MNKFGLIAISLLALSIITASLMVMAKYRDANTKLPYDDQSTGMVADIGGEFTLTNQDGKTVTNKDFLGKYMLVDFGFTYCPDICPMALQTMTQVLDELGPLSEQIVPIFITLDPARDDTKQLKAYVNHFSNKIVALTGDTSDVAAKYKVYYAKAPSENKHDYMIDHSSLIYLMDRDGTYLTHFRHNESIDKMVLTIRDYIKLQ